MNKSANSTQLMSEGKTSNDMQLAELLVWFCGHPSGSW